MGHTYKMALWSIATCCPRGRTDGRTSETTEVGHSNADRNLLQKRTQAVCKTYFKHETFCERTQAAIQERNCEDGLSGINQPTAAKFMELSKLLSMEINHPQEEPCPDESLNDRAGTEVTEASLSHLNNPSGINHQNSSNSLSPKLHGIYKAANHYSIHCSTS